MINVPQATKARRLRRIQSNEYAIRADLSELDSLSLRLASHPTTIRNNVDVFCVNFSRLQPIYGAITLTALR